MAVATFTIPLRVGDMVYGYCQGHWGRDCYEDKRVEAIGGDWVVARGGSGAVHLYEGSPEFLCQFREKPEEEDRW